MDTMGATVYPVLSPSPCFRTEIALYSKRRRDRSDSALSTFDFRVAKLVKSFGLSENRQKS